MPSSDPPSSSSIRSLSGKTYYDIDEARKASNLEGEVAVSRIEQITPFPYDHVRSECLKYGNAEIVWAQEVGSPWPLDPLRAALLAGPVHFRSTRTWGHGASSIRDWPLCPIGE